MTEETTNLKISHIESSVIELKLNDKDQSSKMEKQSDKIIEIEKSNVRIELNLSKILETYTTVKNLALGFFVLNLLGMLYFGSKK